MTLEEHIKRYDDRAKSIRNAIVEKKESQEVVELLRELETYRKLIANADKLIESEYGVVIIEGYKDVLDQMKEIYEEVNADDSNRCED